MRGNGHGDSLIEAIQTPRQREVLERLTCVMTLVEGHGDYVMDAVGPQVVPSVAKIRSRFTARRAATGRVEQTLRRILGIDLKMKQYAEGSRFVQTVVREAGMPVFNRVWTSPETLPVRAELADPHLWLDRVGGGTGPWPPAAADPPMGPPPEVAEVRRAVRRCLEEFAGGDLVLAACSGGADSLALAAALAHEGPRCGLRAGGVTVDHGLQAGSAAVASEVTRVLTGLGLEPVVCLRVGVSREPGHGGPEASARTARYAALADAAHRTGAAAVLLAHSRDDQAESVLLGLARGSGPRSLAGMPECRGAYRRPLLGVGRATLRAACAALGLQPWDDPQNADPAFARARVRHQALPALEAALGPGVAEALARSARQFRADAELLDDLAAVQAGQVRCDDGSWEADRLGRLAGGAQDPGAPAGRHRGRLPGRRADRRPCRGPGIPGHFLARAALDGPARRCPRHAAAWQTLFTAGHPKRAGRRHPGGPGWTRLT